MGNLRIAQHRDGYNFRILLTENEDRKVAEVITPKRPGNPADILYFHYETHWTENEIVEDLEETNLDA